MTPVMKQYYNLKQQNDDCFLLFRMGDFYECFDQDAVIASKVLGITLTSRNSKEKESPLLAGFPHHALDRYLPKLVQAGHKIAICEQTLIDEKQKLFDREVVEVITPGTAMRADCLDEKQNNYLAAIQCVSTKKCGLAYLDLSTGKFVLTEATLNEVLSELSLLQVSEVLVTNEESLNEKITEHAEIEKYNLTTVNKAEFHLPTAEQNLKRHFNVVSLDAFGVAKESVAISCAATILSYAKQMKKIKLSHLVNLQWVTLGASMQIDFATIGHLEILQSSHLEDKNHTLFSLLDYNHTAMGSRLLRYWLVHPLKDVSLIRQRQNALKQLLENESSLEQIRNELKSISDLERLTSKLATQRINARDLLQIGSSLVSTAQVFELVMSLKIDFFKELREDISFLKKWGQDLCSRFVERPPLTVKDGKMLSVEYYPEVKNLFHEAEKGRQWFNSLEKILRVETKISRLRVAFNKVFGYYIEVPNHATSLVPNSFIQKQTLTSATRYVTEEMKQWQTIVLEADERAAAMEYRLFCEIRDELMLETKQFYRLADLISQIDVVQALSQYAQNSVCCLPEISNSNRLQIKDGRHPVIENLIEEGQYIANDVTFDEEQQILLITGPNMGGKSTYLRQAALITLMAQVGSFVPASYAQIGIVDALFTRVGASDRLAQGKSTFMVEMLETASILNNATEKSFILLDEVGRGTSTFDGLSLAQAIVEKIHNNLKAKTLFATHYHELIALSETLPKMKNLSVTIKEVDDQLVFLRKIKEGGCSSSYGIQVAAMAGIPISVTQRASEILNALEKKMNQEKNFTITKNHQSIVKQKQQVLPLENFLSEKEALVLKDLKQINLNEFTPLKLMQKIQKLQERLKEK